MKSKILKIAITLVLILVLVGGVGIPHLRKTSKLFNFLFTPSDWATPLAATNINFGAQGKTYVLNFENKYPGLHWFEVRVSKPLAVAERYKSDFEIQLDIIDGENKIVSKVIKGPGSSFAGVEKGFEIFVYRSPDNLPLRKVIVAKITVVKPDPLFVSMYGGAELAIRKLSDE